MLSLNVTVGKIGELVGSVGIVGKAIGLPQGTWLSRKLRRENIYKMLSAKGNPKISSLVALLRSVGVQLKTEITPHVQMAMSRAG